MKLYFEKLSRFDRKMEYASIAVPFAKGRFFNASRFCVKSRCSDEYFPTQCQITARWDDGSIKWVLVKMLVNLPANRSADYFLATDSDEANFPDIQIIQKGGNVVIDNNCLRMVLGGKGLEEIIKEISVDGCALSSHGLRGFIIYDDKAGERICFLDDWQLLENGPVEAVLTTRGKWRDDSTAGVNFPEAFIKIRIFAGKPYIYVELRIMNMADAEDLSINGLEFKYSNTGAKICRKAVAISNYGTKIIEGDSTNILIDADTILDTANEHMPETLFGTFWADICDENGGFAITIFQAQQNFPKSLHVDDNGLTAGIIPHGSEFKLVQGMAKTHELMLHFHDKDTPLEEINVRSLQYQMPDKPLLDAETYKSGVFDDVFPLKCDPIAMRYLVYSADSRGRAYGMIHWGDAYDENYTKQGRGGGKLVWLNNEYDFPHAAMLMYAISGERRFLDYCLAGVRHWIDIDVCHFSSDPLRLGAQIIHSAEHVTGKADISHEWVEGILDFYHQTGDAFSYNTALGIGENILRHLEQPRYKRAGEINARETGWAMRALIALYKETNDERYICAADGVFEHFKSWKQTFGAFLAPYTDHTVIRVPFMISIAVGSLYRYYSVRKTEEVENMIIEAVDDMIENCLTDNGWFYYKELPSLRRIGSNTLILEALADAYSLTGNKKYLDIGIIEYENLVSANVTRNANNKFKDGDAVIQEGLSPKNFAQSFHPIMRFCVEKEKFRSL